MCQFRSLNLNYNMKHSTQRATGKSKLILQLSSIFVMLLLLNTTFVAALEISNVRAEDVTPNSATVVWETDEPADSFVEYGASETDPAQFIRRGDADDVLTHRLPIAGLVPQTQYQFQVESNGLVDDASGSFYSFQTLAPDLTTSGVVVNLPAIIQGTSLSFNGTAENGAAIRVLVNGRLGASTTARGVSAGALEGTFTVSGMTLDAEQNNLIFVEATDAAGNKANTSSIVFADTHKPQLRLGEIPELVSERAIILNGSVSENSSIEIFANNRSVAQHQTQDGLVFSLEVGLEEGDNTVVVVATDRAGWVTTQQFLINSDTRGPSLRAEIEKGYQYYESIFPGSVVDDNRASSSISGETEAGAKVYLYIYRPQGYEYNPDFSRAVDVATADGNGSFRFKDVDFSLSLRDQLSVKKLTPREVPSALLEYTIFPIQQAVAAQEQVSYHVFLIAEDKSGKTESWQRTVNVNSCSSGDLAFGIENVVKFQQPYRLNPVLLDEGRQEIQAVFKFNYLGQGTPTLNDAGEEYERAYRIKNVGIETACTQAMRDDEKFGLGCQIMPPRSRPVKGEQAVYASWTLMGASEFSKKEDDFWNDFKKRQVVFPIKLTIDYEEKTGVAANGEDVWSAPKTQTSCQDIGYFVDIPVDSADLIPDFIAEDGVALLNTTIENMQTAREYVETAYIITGVSCISSFLGRWVSRGVRQATSRLESWFEFAKPKKLAPETFDENGKCPINQNKLYTRETLENWYALLNANPAYETDVPDKVFSAWEADSKNVDGPESKKIMLDANCDSTATAWKLEAALDQAYRWTCDRAFCRSVPAGWTEDQKEEEITRVIQEQNACAVTGRGAPLIPVENCKERIEKGTSTGRVDKDKLDVCWELSNVANSIGDRKNILYARDLNWEKLPEHADKISRDERQYIFHLIPVGSASPGLVIGPEDLIVYQPPGSEGLIAGVDKTCAQVCDNPLKKDPTGKNFKPDTILGNPNNGCYIEREDVNGVRQLYDKNGFSDDNLLGAASDDPRHAAGYTRDCFVDYSLGTGEPQFSQCVCLGKNPGKQNQVPSIDRSLRTAVESNKNGPGQEEKWSYHQERVYKESKGKVGTYYPEIRYYSGRDFSGAFGQDYLLDYLPGKKKVAKVDPHAGLIESTQAMCTSGILKHMVMIESILVGLRNCLVEAKYTGVHDAGACKTWFTQNVCGLVYKGVAGLISNSCTPSNFDDVGKDGAFDDIGVIVKEGTEGMGRALQSSIDDIKADYGNAQLNNYFSGGAQGFAQSMCMAAFGFDFPLFSDDFLMDAAYAFPTQSNVIVAPAFRELSTFNPAKQTAIHNYEIGAVIMPGCRITRSQISLKCIGPEDDQMYGVDPTCNGKGCDCLRASGAAEFAGERSSIIDQSFNLQGGRMFSVPIETPKRIDSHFRYDHVKVELELDPSENPELCFDEKVRQGRRGVWYFPITDVTPQAVATCSVDAVSGRYNCPELNELFGSGQAAIESPYVQCYDVRKEQWVDCRTPNLFVGGDRIRTRVNIVLNGKTMCLKATPANLPTYTDNGMMQLPENVQGSYPREIDFGIVSGTMFGGVMNQLQMVSTSSNEGCPRSLSPAGAPENVDDGKEFVFSYTPKASGVYELAVPAGVTLHDSATRDGYTINNNILAQHQRSDLLPDQINRATFNADGFIISQVMGRPDLDSQLHKCTYRIAKKSVYATQSNAKDIRVNYQLYQPEEGSCSYATVLAKKPAIGVSSYTQLIHIQREFTAVAEVGGMHDLFMQDNYNRVFEIASQELKEKRGDMTNALALYYNVLALIMKGQEEKDINKYASSIKSFLRYFFERNYDGEIVEGYLQEEVQDTDDYKKMFVYLCEVDKKYEAGYCKPEKLAAVQASLAAASLCGEKGYNLPGVAGDLYAYKCDDNLQGNAQKCLISTGEETLSFPIANANAATKDLLTAQCLGST